MADLPRIEFLQIQALHRIDDVFIVILAAIHIQLLFYYEAAMASSGGVELRQLSPLIACNTVAVNLIIFSQSHFVS